MYICLKRTEQGHTVYLNIDVGYPNILIVSISKAKHQTIIKIITGEGQDRQLMLPGYKAREEYQIKIYLAS